MSINDVEIKPRNEMNEGIALEANINATNDSKKKSSRPVTFSVGKANMKSNGKKGEGKEKKEDQKKGGLKKHLLDNTSEIFDEPYWLKEGLEGSEDEDIFKNIRDFNGDTEVNHLGGDFQFGNDEKNKIMELKKRLLKAWKHI